MKRINRYAALRIPNNLNYEYNVNTMKRQKYMKSHKRRNFYYAKNITNRRFPVVCRFTNGKLAMLCPLCYKILCPDLVNYKQYRRCKNCGLLCDTQTKEVLRYYYRHFPSIYSELCNHRLNYRIARHKLKKKHQEEKEKKHLKDMYPQITVWNNDGKEEIITNITKELRESDDLSLNEKSILIRLQIPLERYRVLQTLDVNLVDYISESVNAKEEKCNNQERGDLK